ncbi:NOP15 [Acanthosepion pharaonis]|uniref:NOP15 n=1 Tax=Acanthosepion pharaonis TaxID=158019 RepID=A0A812E1K3_ACAPH|nr:NOP15 [Sepia pharaonis]
MPENAALDVNEQKEFTKKLKNYPKKVAVKPGVVYIGQIPHGFYENQMREFFGQFGKVRRLRLSRSKKTGNSKGFAFIEFESEEVAEIVAETMDNYLMYEKLLKCKVVPPEKVKPGLFIGCNRPFRKPKSHIIARKRHNKPKSTTQQLASTSKVLKGLKKKMAKFEELGIQYNPKELENSLEKQIQELKGKKSKSKTAIDTS